MSINNWLRIIIWVLLLENISGQLSQLQKELGLYGVNIGAKVGDKRSEKSAETYDEMDQQTDIEVEESELFFESSLKSIFESNMEGIISDCETYPSPSTEEFVKVQGTQFTFGGSPFYFMGMNSYHLTNIEKNLKDQRPEQVDTTFKKARDLGLQVVRLWAFSENIRTSPTDWNEDTFLALDSIIDKAQKYNIKLVLALMNYWEQFNGTDSQVSMVYKTIKGKSIEDFYTDVDVKLLYKSQVCKIINRKNTITGKKYRDDPTIMAWNLMNEARCTNCRGQAQHAGVLGGLIGEWMDEMASFVKSLDPNHLVTSGSEGFFGRQSSLQVLNDNPGSWAQCTGDDFVLIHDSPDIDYAVMHVYPEHKSWNFEKEEPCDMECILDWLVVYIYAHFQEAQNTLGKPVVIEEFGLSTKLERQFKSSDGSFGEVNYSPTERIDYFKRVLGIFLQSAQNGEAGAGVMLWTGAVDRYNDYDGFTIYIDQKSLDFEQSSTVKPRRVQLLEKFRKTEELEPCSLAEYGDGFNPNPISLIPTYIILQGNSVVEVIEEANIQLKSFGSVFRENVDTSPDIVIGQILFDPPTPTSTPSLPPPQQTTPPPPPPLLGADYGSDGDDYDSGSCSKLQNTVIGGTVVGFMQANSFEDCCSACQANIECNSFTYCEKSGGCFDRFVFVPFKNCDLQFQQTIEDGQQPEITYEGDETQIVSGYL